MAALAPQTDDGEHRRMAETYKGCFIEARAAGRVEEPLFPGIADLLDRLEADGWLLAVATGKSDRGLRHCLDCHGFAERFISLQTADRHPSKPHPSMVLQAMADAGAAPETTVVIGDTVFDVEMAVAAGAKSIGVDWGYHDAAELLAAGAAAVAETPSDIYDLMQAMVVRA
jgi:phosphoglycolate phosphatase